MGGVREHLRLVPTFDVVDMSPDFATPRSPFLPLSSPLQNSAGKMEPMGGMGAQPRTAATRPLH